jgi:phenylalanyl-tRNA synthetase beta chain
VAGHNHNHGQQAVRLFEFGRVHTKRQTNRTLVGDYTETETLMVLASGRWQEQYWEDDARDSDLFDVKGVMDRVFGAIGLEMPRYKQRDASDLASWGVDILLGKRWIGSLMRVSDDVADAYSLRHDGLVAELDFTALAEAAAAAIRPTFQAISRFPIVERDIAVVVPSTQPAGPMLETIRRAAGDLLKKVFVFDFYEGKHVGEGNKSLAFGLRLGADRTLRDKDVDKVMSRVLKALEREFDAKLRG